MALVILYHIMCDTAEENAVVSCVIGASGVGSPNTVVTNSSNYVCAGDQD